MSHSFSQTGIHKYYQLLLCLLLLPTITTQAQNVGIGLLSPTAKLHVRVDGTNGFVGGMLLEAPNMATTSTTAFAFGKNTTYGNMAELRYTWLGNSDPMNRFEFGFSSIQPFVAFTANERVGIGTLNPSTTLHVVGQVRIEDGNVGIGTSDPTYPLTLGGTDVVLGVENNSLFMAKNNEGVYEPFIYPRWGDNRTLMNYGTGGFQIRDMTYTTRFSITNDGNVGINTEYPSTALHVVGQLRIEDDSQAAGKVLTSDAYGFASWQTPSVVETDPQVTSTTSNKIPKWNGTSLVDGLITDDGTNVGIGTSNPTYPLTLGGTDAVLGVENSGVFMAKNYDGVYEPFLYPRWIDDRTLMNYGTGGFQIRDMTYTTRFSITNDGNVGINTESPSTALHVVGQLRIEDDSQANGKVLMSDANGVASWQNPPAGIETDPQVSSAISNCVPKWNGTALADGLIFDNGTNVGIGTLSPTNNLHVESTGTSEYAGSILLNAPSMVAGSQAVLKFGKNEGYGNQAELRFDYEGNNSTANRYEFGFSNVQPFVFFTAAERVGIGTFNPGGQLELSLDQGRKPSTSTWTITSDARVKTIEGQYTRGLNEILQLNPIKYHYINSRAKTFSPEVLAAENVGLTAQEVQQVFPEAVGVDPDGTLNLNMHPILIAQLNAIKELNALITSQQQQIDMLTAKLDEVLTASTPVIQTRSINP